MIPPTYEKHIHEDPDFPIIFHLNTLHLGYKGFVMHWHESLELLYFIEGSANVICDTKTIAVGVGEIVLINSNNLHTVYATTESCKYYCLIIDKNYIELNNIIISRILFENKIIDGMAQHLFDKIIQEMLDKRLYYKLAVKSNVLALLVHLTRYHCIQRSIPSEYHHNKITMVKDAISYIKQNYKVHISIDDICNEIGFSKYYFCRAFKSITGKTVVDYINFLRCTHARNLLIKGDLNISQVAEECGYFNLSYFSKTYKKYMGKLPSEE